MNFYAIFFIVEIPYEIMWPDNKYWLEKSIQVTGYISNRIFLFCFNGCCYPGFLDADCIVAML